MERFFEKIIKPILIKYEPSHIVEIGVFLAGRSTIKLLEFCKMMNSKLTVIDPAPGFNTYAYEAVFSEELVLHKKHSLEILSEIETADLVLIDGDHNWYTVYHELMAIEQIATKTGEFPIVILHDTEWPYGRRDSYYFPETIPLQYQKPHAKKGIRAGSSELVDTGGINEDQHNAMNEYGEENGVLTAIEDFLKVTAFSLSFHRVNTNNGLGILVPKDTRGDVVMQFIMDTSGL
ncbi:class I SAM-dependent methyltransferase [Paenibacillus qinlingensis]|uniref:class I SAM-dependent methyltransferase n=1 Tax=Paenibacillus qinlingensis TaxID=1837343 RepID=UPI001564B7AE|nr:class I SAM-dependent methyltransferase [Paenibacillus qinlingensis]NQX57873.1 class I SAM-dependent methyltransferase [Paenibacillus qinlingensis]